MRFPASYRLNLHTFWSIEFNLSGKRTRRILVRSACPFCIDREESSLSLVKLRGQKANTKLSENFPFLMIKRLHTAVNWTYQFLCSNRKYRNLALTARIFSTQIFIRFSSWIRGNKKIFWIKTRQRITSELVQPKRHIEISPYGGMKICRLLIVFPFAKWNIIF